MEISISEAVYFGKKGWRENAWNGNDLQYERFGIKAIVNVSQYRGEKQFTLFVLLLQDSGWDL